MAFRTIGPLSDHDWKILVDGLIKGPTPEQQKRVRDAIKRVRGTKMSIMNDL